MLTEIAPWYAHITNYLVTGEIPSEWKAQDKKHFFAKNSCLLLGRAILIQILCGPNNTEVCP